MTTGIPPEVPPDAPLHSIGWREPRFAPMADHGLLATFGDRIEEGLSRRIGELTLALDALTIAGIRDLVPAYASLTVLYDPIVIESRALQDRIARLWAVLEDGPERRDAPARELVIPVQYGGEFGPDLLDVARHTGLSPAEVVRRHAAARYVVGALGFAPGFGFLIGLPPELATPRRRTPRSRIPPGSVGIGGGQTGVYSLPTPGGWSLIGRTPLTLFDPAQEPASLLATGDVVRFDPIDQARFAELTVREPKRQARMAREPAGRSGIAVLEPGLQTTVQDLGRWGHGRIGVSPGGAADREALIAGNRAVGNAGTAAGLEITRTGPRLRFLIPARIALTGADLGARLGDLPLLPGSVRAVHPGDELWFDRNHPPRGFRAWLCVAGGIDVPVLMGSRSTDLAAGMGGLDGRPLAAGDVLPIGRSRRSPVLQPDRTERSSLGPLRIVAGPERERVDARTWVLFLTSAFTVSPQSNRVGLRLDGPSLSLIGGADIISSGMVTGLIQITGEGQPIVALPARATVGGYPRIATVIAADLDCLGQLAPGDSVRFSEVTLDDALQAL